MLKVLKTSSDIRMNYDFHIAHTNESESEMLLPFWHVTGQLDQSEKFVVTSQPLSLSNMLSSPWLQGMVQFLSSPG